MEKITVLAKRLTPGKHPSAVGKEDEDGDRYQTATFESTAPVYAIASSPDAQTETVTGVDVFIRDLEPTNHRLQLPLLTPSRSLEMTGEKVKQQQQQQQQKEPRRRNSWGFPNGFRLRTKLGPGEQLNGGTLFKDKNRRPINGSEQVISDGTPISLTPPLNGTPISLENVSADAENGKELGGRRGKGTASSVGQSSNIQPVAGTLPQLSTPSGTGEEAFTTLLDSGSIAIFSPPPPRFGNKSSGGKGDPDTSISIESLHRHRSSGASSGASQIRLNFDRLQAKLFGRDDAREQIWEAFLRVCEHPQGAQQKVKMTVASLPTKPPGVHDTDALLNTSTHHTDGSAQGGNRKSISGSTTSGSSNQRHRIETVFIHGPSGVGKSRLVENFQNRLRNQTHTWQQQKETLSGSTCTGIGTSIPTRTTSTTHYQPPFRRVRRVFFLQSKYQQELGSSLPEPFSAFQDATEQLGGLLADESAHDTTGYIRRMLVDGLAVHEIRLLVRLCPELKRVLLSRGNAVDQNRPTSNNIVRINEGGENDDSQDSDDNEDDLRVRMSMASDFSRAEMGLLFLRLIRVIGQPSHPIVLFLDDIQWADPDSLDLISTLVHEENCRNFMLIVAFRDELSDGGHSSSGVNGSLSDKLSVHSIIARKVFKVDAAAPPSLSGATSMALSQAPKWSLATSRSNFMLFGQNSDRHLVVARHRNTKHNMYMQQPNSNEAEDNRSDPDTEMAPPPTFLRKAVTIGTYNPSKFLHSFERKPADMPPLKVPKHKQLQIPKIAATATKPKSKRPLSLLDDDSDDEETTLHMLGPVPSVPRPIPFAQGPGNGIDKSNLSKALPPMPAPLPPMVASPGYQQMKDKLRGREGEEERPTLTSHLMFSPSSDSCEIPPPTLLSKPASPTLPKILSRENAVAHFPEISQRGANASMTTDNILIDDIHQKIKPIPSTSTQQEISRQASWSSRSIRSIGPGRSPIGTKWKRPIVRPPQMSRQRSSRRKSNRLPSVSESTPTLTNRTSELSLLRKFHGLSGRTIRHSQMSDLSAGFADTNESVLIELRNSSDIHSTEDFLVARYCNVIDLPLRNLEEDVVCEIIAYLTSLEIHDCLSLACVITKKTHGNPTSVLRFLDILQQDGLLRYSMGICRWEWDAEYINNSTTVTSDVGELLAARIKNLPRKSLAVLKLAACIGFSFHRQLLENLAKEDFSSQTSAETEGTVEEIQTRYQEDLRQILDESYSAGLVEMTDRDTLYRFSHDLIHQNLYSKIEEDKKKRLHLRIARAMQGKSYFERSSLNLFILVNHFNCGQCEIETDHERVQVVELNLRASIAARAECSFRSAALFLENAISYLKGESDWSSHYSLVLEVYSSAAEVQFSCGELQKSTSYAEEVVRNARDTKDQIRGHFIKLENLGRERRYTQALEEGFRILGILGCKIPERMKGWYLSRDLAEIKKNIKGKTTEDFLAMKSMTDFIQISCLRLMDTMTLFFVLKGDDSMAGLLLSRMMLMTLKNGISIYSPYSFAAYGMLLYHLGDTEGGHHYGTIGLRIAEQLRSKRALTRTAFIFYTFLNHVKKPLTDGIEPMLNAHRIGLQVGDVEYSSMCLTTYSNLYIAVGLPLQPYMEDMKQYCEQLELYRQSQPIALMAPFRQLALNLMGHSENPLVLNGDAMNFEEFCHRFMVSGEVNEGDQAVTYCNLMYATLLLAYIFQDTNRMQEWFRHRLPKTGVLTASHFDKLYITLFSGLAGFSLYRKTGRPRYYRKAKKALSDMKRFSIKCGINAIPMYRLLVAEKQQFAKDRDRTIKSYDESISTFARCGMIHLEAIACERAGDYMKSRADTFWSQSYYGRSQIRYMEWGATAKAEQMNSDHHLQNFQFKSRDKVGSAESSSEETNVQSPNAYISLRGRRRYDASTWQTIAKTDMGDN